MKKSVKELIKSLLEYPMDNEAFVEDGHLVVRSPGQAKTPDALGQLF